MVDKYWFSEIGKRIEISRQIKSNFLLFDVLKLSY